MSEDFPDVRQYSDNDCGSACLIAIVRHMKGVSDSAEIHTLMNGRDEIGSAYDIVAFARRLSLDAIGASVPARDLTADQLPAILHWGWNHFVVLYGHDAGGARILDPSGGKFYLPWDLVERNHTGVTLLFGRAATVWANGAQ